MSKRQIIFIIGILVAINPFTGFTSSIKEILIVVGGLVIAGIALTLKKEKSEQMKSEVKSNIVIQNNVSPFVESNKGGNIESSI